MTSIHHCSRRRRTNEQLSHFYVNKDMDNCVPSCSLEWPRVDAIRLVREYRARPELWDPGHDLARVLTVKYDAYAQLAEIFSCDVTDVKKKLNSIFASHRREKAKVRAGGRTKWFLYSHLDFLPNHVQNVKRGAVVTTPRESSKRVASENEEEDETTSEPGEDDGEIAEEIIIKEEPEVMQAYKPVSKPASKTPYVLNPRPPRKIPRKSPKQQLLGELLHTVKLLKKSDVLKKKDECDSFGEYIAVSLRKHDDRTQSMIKQAINNILFEQEMKKYTTSQYTVVITEENPLLEQET